MLPRRCQGGVNHAHAAAALWGLLLRRLQHLLLLPTWTHLGLHPLLLLLWLLQRPRLLLHVRV